jgi:arylsulfatase A-like enzyme
VIGRSLLGLAISVVTGCGHTAAPAPKTNVLLVTLDTTRADHLGCYGDGNAATPTLDALASEGVRFSQAFSPAPITLVAHASLLTGLPPFAHGLRDNGAGCLPPEVETYAGFLGGHGYHTAAVIGSVVLARGYGLWQGFAIYEDHCPAGRVSGGFRARRASDVADTALRILAERPRDRPFFLWLHFFDPHDPYEPPEPYKERFKDRPYDGEIAYTDSELGRVIAALRQEGILERTLVVCCADHGESLGEHGEQTHGFFVYDATQHVPLVMRGGGLPAGRVDSTLVSLIDVMPTVAGLIGLHETPGSGRDLSTALLENRSVTERPVYLESYLTFVSLGWSGEEGWRTSRFKFIDAPTPELYDLSQDPGEKTSLEDPAKRESMRAELERFRKSARAIAPHPIDLSDGDRQSLEALGYLGAGASSNLGNLDPRNGIDPKVGVTMIYPRINEALKQQQENNFAGAIRIFENLLIEVPDDILSLSGLATCQMKLGQIDEAEKNLRRLVARRPEMKTAWINLAGCAMARERWRDAVVILKRAVAIDPTTISALDSLSICYEKLGDLREARDNLSRAIGLLPETATAARTQMLQRLHALEQRM